MCICGEVLRKAMTGAKAAWGSGESLTKISECCDESSISSLITTTKGCSDENITSEKEKGYETTQTSNNLNVISKRTLLDCSDKSSEHKSPDCDVTVNNDIIGKDCSNKDVQNENCDPPIHQSTSNIENYVQDKVSSEQSSHQDQSSNAHSHENSAYDQATSTNSITSEFSDKEEDYFKPLKKLRMIQHLQDASNPKSILDQPKQILAVKSFSISDILSSNFTRTSRPEVTPKPSGQGGSNAFQPVPLPFVRPWDTDDEEIQDAMSISSSASSHSSPRPSSSGPVLETVGSKPGSTSGQHAKGNGNPLDALFKLTSDTFDDLKNSYAADDANNQLNLFNNKQSSKKKRKSRTAFTNHQIFELEKRFLYQKYLSPADRDELSQNLGLSNAQVITWFQNRRAKLKRDMEELKKDVHTASLLGDHSAFIKTMTQMGLLKSKANLESAFMCRK